MKPFRATAILAAAALATTLSGCGDDEEPTVQESPAATQQPPADDARETSEAPGGTEQPDETDAPDTTDEEGAADLPTDPAEYGDVFVQAWVDQDQTLLEQMAGPDVLQAMTMWPGQGWSQVEVRQEEHGAVIVDYTDEQNMELTIWVHKPTIQAGEPHGVTSATVSEGDYPIPSSVEDYASAFVSAAGTGDQEFLERLGTDEAVASAENWSGFAFGGPEVSDGDDETTARVTFPGEDGVDLVVTVDRELAESASEDAVLEALLDGGLPEMSVEDYADSFVLAFGEGDAETMGYYATDEVVDELRDAGGPGWSRTDTQEEGSQVIVTYEDADDGRTLTLTVDAEMVAAREYQAIIAAEIAA